MPELLQDLLMLICLSCIIPGHWHFLINYRYLYADIPELYLNDYRYLDAEMLELLQVPWCWHSWTVTSTWCWRSWMITDTWMLKCLNYWKYWDPDMHELLQLPDIHEHLQVPGWWYVWSETGKWNTSTPEFTRVPGRVHVWIVPSTWMLTCLNCYKYLGADMSELLQVPWCWHMSELLQVPWCWHVCTVTGTWMLTSVQQHNTGEYMCTAPHMDPVSSLLTVLPGWFRLVLCIWVNSGNTSRRIFKCNEIVKSCWVLGQLCYYGTEN